MKLAEKVLLFSEAFDTEQAMKNVPIQTGKVRFFNASDLKGSITGDDGGSYDIFLNQHNKKDVKTAKKIKDGMKIKFKDLDVEPPMAYIGDFSFK